MSKRGRPRKKPILESEIPSDDEDNIIPKDITPDEIPKESKQATEAVEADIPEAWENIPLLELGKKGWTYRRKADKKGVEYMHIRNRSNERGLGRYTPEREKLFFELFPIFYRPNKGVETEPPEIVGEGPNIPSEKGLGRKPFFNIPIKRVAVIPGDYRPTMEVIRYYHLYKNNDFPGDFSDFMNGIIRHHFVKCNGVALPVYINEELIVQNA
jgi:hypothetical protein